MSIPEGLGPELIGKVVTFQAFAREEPGSDTIKRDTLSKYVGVLQMYYSDSTGFIFKLEGDETRTCVHETHYIEVHPFIKRYVFG